MTNHNVTEEIKPVYRGAERRFHEEWNPLPPFQLLKRRLFYRHHWCLTDGSGFHVSVEIDDENQTAYPSLIKSAEDFLIKAWNKRAG